MRHDLLDIILGFVLAAAVMLIVYTIITWSYDDNNYHDWKGTGCYKDYIAVWDGNTNSHTRCISMDVLTQIQIDYIDNLD